MAEAGCEGFAVAEELWDVVGMASALGTSGTVVMALSGFSR